MNVDNVQYSLKIFVMFFNDLTIIIVETLSNNHAGFKFDDINERLEIVENQLIDDVFASFDVIDNEFQNDNEDQRKLFLLFKKIFSTTF